MAHPYDTSQPGHWHKRYSHVSGTGTSNTHVHDFSSTSIPAVDPINYYTFQRCPAVVNNHQDTVNCKTGEPTITKNGYQVSLDFHRFVPNDITVKMVGNSVLVEANHDIKQDEHGCISHQYNRQFDLPAGFNANHVVPELSEDGILTIEAYPEYSSGPLRTDIKTLLKMKGLID